MSSVQIGHQPAASAGSSPSACAACKYQRRKCNKDCVLAPYFPADNQRQFLNAHRLFGVANIMKIFNSVDPDRRKFAMRSIIDQSNIRASDPVGGCYRLVVELERRIKAAHNELEFLKTRIAFYRAQMGNMRNIGGPSHEANYHPAIAGANLYHPNMAIVQPHQQYYNYYLFGAPEGQGSDLNGNMIANGVGHDMNINVPAASHGLDMEMLSLGQVVDAEEEAKPLDIFNMRPGFEVEGDSREITAESSITAFHYSAKIEPNDEANHMENVLEHDLKGAASLFTLTNCNTR